MVTIETHFNASQSEEQFEKLVSGTVGEYVDYLLGPKSNPAQAPPHGRVTR